MLDTLIGGYGHGFGHKDHVSSGYGFEGHNEFMSHEDSERGHYDRQARYDHHMRLPANRGRPPVAHMPVCEEEDSDDEGFNKSSLSHHTTVLPHHGNNHHQQKPHMNFMHPPPMAQPHHNGLINGWQGRHDDGYHGGHGLQKNGSHGMQQHGGHGMQHHDEHGMQHHGRHGMQHHDGHGGHGMQQHGGHGMQQHGAHDMQHHGAHGMKQHHDRLMGPQVPPHHVYMNPSHGNGSGRTVMVKASENWRMSNSTGGHHKVGWGSKGL